jgi:hypothetical protein
MMKKTVAPTKQGDSFESLAGKVEKAVKSYPTSFQKNVIEYLKQKNLDGYKDDFVSEMKKGEDFGKFVGTKPREDTGTTNCFDNSFLRYAGLELPKLCPAGEKYDFETPYLMSLFGWNYVTQGTKCFLTKMSAFLKTVKVGHSYLVMTREYTAATIGHTVTLYVPSTGVVWLHDPQMVAPPSADNVCEAWESGTKLGSTKKPGRYLSVKTVKPDGDWETD